MYRVGIDIGGTFTDMLLVGEDGTAIIGKTLTTPGDPSLAVENALRPALENGTVKTGARGTLDPRHDAGDQRADRAQGRADGAAHDDGLPRRRRDRPRAPLRPLRSRSSRCPKPLVPRHLRFEVPRAHGRRRQRAAAAGRERLSGAWSTSCATRASRPSPSAS